MPCLGQSRLITRNNEINHGLQKSIVQFCLWPSAKSFAGEHGAGKLLHRRSGNSRLGLKQLKQISNNQLCTCQSFSGIQEPSISSLNDASHLTGISLVLWAGVFWFAYRLLLQMNDSESHGRECETCGGSGYVECFCTRWSDGDSKGCSSCGGSLQTVCHSCRGGGTAVPILGKVYIKDEKDYRM